MVYLLAWGYLHWFQFLTPYLSEPDPHYHIKAAWLMRTQGILRDFPWAEHSIWREAWFNKDFGFHVLLLPFTRGDLVGGAKLAAVTYGAAVFTSFFAVLRLSGVRHAWFWTLLLFCAGSFWGYRVNVARPQLISIICSLWVVLFVIRRSPLGVGVLTFLFALGYAAPHVAVGYAIIFWLAVGLRDGRFAPWLPLAALAGWMLGWVVHPNFPDTFAGWWIQNVNVLQASWSASAPALGMAAELHPADTRSLLLEHIPLVTLALGAVLLWPHVSDRSDPRLVTILIVGLGYALLTMLSKRFIELSVPFGIWGIAAIFTSAGPTLARLGWRAKVPAVLALVLVMGIGGYRTAVNNRALFSTLSYQGIPTASRWLFENTPRDSLIFTCDWDDAPELFLYNHRNRYMVFLDPMFMYAWRPTLFETWRTVAQGQHVKPVETIRDAFGAAGGFCTGNFGRLRRQLEADGRVRLEGRPGGVYVFVFEDEERDE